VLVPLARTTFLSAARRIMFEVVRSPWTSPPSCSRAISLPMATSIASTSDRQEGAGVWVWVCVGVWVGVWVGWGGVGWGGVGGGGGAPNGGRRSAVRSCQFVEGAACHGCSAPSHLLCLFGRVMITRRRTNKEFLGFTVNQLEQHAGARPDVLQQPQEPPLFLPTDAHACLHRPSL
jgi:hypothetical protein